MKNRKLQGKFVFTGLFAISVSEVIRFYLKLPDLVSGFLMGGGIGVLLMALKMKKSSADRLL
jgi:hypothetical protein